MREPKEIRKLNGNQKPKTINGKNSKNCKPDRNQTKIGWNLNEGEQYRTEQTGKEQYRTVQNGKKSTGKAVQKVQKNSMEKNRLEERKAQTRGE